MESKLLYSLLPKYSRGGRKNIPRTEVLKYLYVVLYNPIFKKAWAWNGPGFDL